MHTQQKQIMSLVKENCIGYYDRSVDYKFEKPIIDISEPRILDILGFVSSFRHQELNLLPLIC